MTAVRSALLWILMFVTLIVMSVPFLLWSIFDRVGMRIYPLGVAYMRVCVFYIGMKIRVSGRENIPPGRMFILMPNHRSYWDIPAVQIAIFPHQLRFVAKKQLASIPVFGWCMRQAGHILIDREDRERAIRTLLEVARRFSALFSIVIFPEGTRSPGRHLLRFKRGGFHLARELGLPILPVSISRSQAIMDRHSPSLHPGQVKVHFHPPVDPAAFERIGDLVQAVRKAVASGIEDLEPDPSE